MSSRKGGVLRRFVGALVALALVAGAPGSEAYNAAAQSAAGRAGEAGGSARVIPAIGVSDLTSIPNLSLSAPSLVAPSLSAPSIAPALTVPAALNAAPAKPASLGEQPVIAVPVGKALSPVVAAPSLPAAKTAAEAPVQALKPALDSRLSAPVVSEKPAEKAASEASAVFDGAKSPVAETPAVSAKGGWSLKRALVKGMAILTLSIGMLGAQNAVHAQSVPPPAVKNAQIQDLKNKNSKNQAELIKKLQAAMQAAAQAQAPPAAAPAANATTQPAQPVVPEAVASEPLPRPVVAAATIDRQGVTVGQRVHLTFTLKNTSDKPVTLQNLRASIQEALPRDLEIQGDAAELPLTLAPGESKVVVYEAIPFSSGVMTLDGGVAVVAVAQNAQYPKGVEIVFPGTELTIKTVLTPDWKDKGLKDIVGPERADGPDFLWLAAIPLGILLLVGAARLVAARRLYPKLTVERLSVVTVAEAAIERLRLESAALDAASFHARYQDVLTDFMVDFAGMKKGARDAAALKRDLAKSVYTKAQAGLAAQLAAAAEAARFSGVEKDESERGRMLDRLQALVESVAQKEGKPAAEGKSKLPAFLALAGAAGLHFGSPWVLLLLIPYFAYLLYSWRSRGKGERFAVSSSAQAPKRRTWREGLAGMPRVLRLAAIGLILVALARPMIGTQREETFIPSTDTMVSIDLSGSMSGPKLDGVREAVKAYVEEQRKGTENRVGMVTFSDNAYLDVKLTTDYDALIGHLKELQTTSSTAIGKAMLTSIAHFAELNALELDAKSDPRVAQVQKLLKEQGLSAALEYAKPYPDLMKQILQPERVKIVVVFTDGESNTGIPPVEAAKIAASLGVKVYTVGIGENGTGYDSQTLKDVATITGAKFYAAGDAQAMREVLLDISRLEKSPAKIVSSVSVKDYTSLLALLAFLMLGGELLLANTKLRTLYGVAFLSASLLGPGNLSQLPGLNGTAISAQVSTVKDPTKAVPPEMIEGNRLYNQGRFGEALKKYGEALERHPDVPEIYFNMADAYLRLGQTEKADAAWQKYLQLTKDPKEQSRVLFNLGNSALMARNGEKAIELYKEALRRDSGNTDAKWNLEVLRQAQKEQQKQQQQQQDQQGQQGKPKDGKQDGKPQDKPGESKDGKQHGQQGKPKDGQGKPGQGKGQPGQGQPGQGQPGQGQPGDGKGQGQVQPGQKDAKKGADQLGQALGDQEKGEKNDALKGMTRKGSGVWGVVPALPLAFLGHGIAFSSAGLLWAVGIGLPLLVLVVAWGLKKRLAAAKKLSPYTAPKDLRSWWGARRFLGKAALTLAAAGLIGLSAGDPRGGMTDERVNFGGKDIVVTVDGSYSMVYAEDGRMERTQKELNEFITRLQGTDRVGLVVFSGQARTASPISIDYGNFEFKINRLDVEARGLREGSDLAAAIKFSANHFETAKKLGDRQRIMIVISDGDVPDADLDAAIAAATEHHVTVYAIGVGSPTGTKIKVPTADGGGTEYLIDSKTGAPATTQLNEAPLRKLAERTGGAYFRSGGRTSIDGILDQVSRLEQGQKGDSIKSPSPIGVYFLWPALMMLLLDLVLPGRSLLRRPAAAKKDEKDAAKSDKGAAGGMLLGAALIPLGAWPQILPFALLATLLLGYLTADAWTGGAVTRRIKDAWGRRQKVVEKGVVADLLHLYDLREADEARLARFVSDWAAAKEPARVTLLEVAANDEVLWREMLTAAYLSGAAPETLDKTAAALRRAARRRLEPLKPVVARLAARKAGLSWMDHADARLRLAALEAVAAGQPVPFDDGGWKAAPRAPGLWSRLKRGATVGLLAVMIAITGASSVGTLSFQREQAAAVEASARLFYAEDLYIFTDRYVDSRIPDEVLPALKRWHESPKTAGADFERALQILRESPDPKADNILVAIFRRGGILPLTPKAESIMLKTLVERDNDALWNSMDQLIAASKSSDGASRLLIKLVMAGVEDGNDRAIVQLFRVLKSPDREVQQQAAGLLFSYFSRDGGAKFFEGLTLVQAKHQNDPSLQLWAASFAFRRLAAPNAGEADLVQAKTFLDQSLANAQRFDAIRVEIFKQTPPDKEVQAPPSMTTMLLSIADRLQGDGGAPAPVQGAAKYLVARATTALIQDAEKQIPGLHERLIKDGVVLADDQGGSYGGGYEEDERGYYEHGYGGYGRRGPSSNYREVYKLSHLRLLAKAVAEMGTPLAAAPSAENAGVRELLDRALPQLETSLETGAKAGMMEGGTPGEAAADDMLATLKTGESVFTNHALLRVLRAEGLAPAVGDFSSALAYPESLDADQLGKLRGVLLGVARSGKSWDNQGKERPITWAEKLYIAGALETIDAVRAKDFPAAAAFPAADESALSLARLSRELTAKNDSATAVSVESRLLAAVAAAPQDPAETAALLAQVFGAVKGTAQENAAVDALAAALRGPNGKSLAPAALARSLDGLHQVAEQGEKAFPGLKAALVEAGARASESDWRPDVKLRHFAVVRDSLAAAAASTKALTPEQKAAADAGKSLARFQTLAALAGAPAGDTPAELAADETNVVLLAGYRLFAGSDFNNALRAQGMMPGAGNTLSDYKQVYTKAELEAIRTWMAGLARSDMNLAASPARLSWPERQFLAKSLDRLDAILAARFGDAPAAVPAGLRASVERPGQEGLALARLLTAVEAHKGDGAFALEAEQVLFALMSTRSYDQADAEAVLSAIRDQAASTPSEAAVYGAYAGALKARYGKVLADSAPKAAQAVATALGEDAEKAFPSLGKTLVESGVRDGETSWRDDFRLVHYRLLRAQVDAAFAKVKKPTAAQRAVAARADELLPRLESVAGAAGVLPGDTPGELAADLVNAPLQDGYTVFPGAVFNDQLRALGLMDAGNGAGDHRATYTKAQLETLRGFLAGTLSSGQGWESDGKTRRALTDSEKKTLREALAATERALAGFEGTKTTAHAFAPLLLAAALPAAGVMPMLLFAAVLAAVVYFAYGLLMRDAAEDRPQPARSAVSGEVFSRMRRVELSARRLATAVNGGSFRSRFIGAGGTEFAESRPYQGEDIREIDWKTSAKKDELYSKKFELERDMPLMLVVDVSGSGRFGTRGEDKRTAIEDAAATLALAAAHSSVRVGLILVSDRVETVIPARGGTKHAMMIVDAILKAQPTGKTTDLKPGLETAGRVLGSRGMVAVLSDFISADFKDALGALASRHDVRPIVVNDPAELAPLPDVGLLPVVDAETGAVKTVDTSSPDVRREAAAEISRRSLALEAAFDAARLKPITLSTEGDPLETLELAFQPKSKQPFTP